jgi:hypothetical protein
VSRHQVRGLQVPWFRPGLVALLAVLAVVAVGTAAPTGVRVVALLLFLLLGPGLGLVGLLEIGEPWRETSFVIGVSLAVDLIVVTALAYRGSRTAGEAFAVLVGIAVLGASAQVARGVTRRARRSVSS